MFDDIDALLTAAGVLFGTVATLAVTVTGFFLGRKWIKRI